MGRHAFFILVALIICGFGCPSLARFEPAENKQSAEIGRDGFVFYDMSEETIQGRNSRCRLDRYNCTTPHGLCSDDHDKYQLEYVEGSEVVNSKYTDWQCRIRIKQVTLDDVGPYLMCIRPPKDGDIIGPCINYAELQVDFAAWERDEHGRICQTSYDDISTELVNNCSVLTTQLVTTEKEETPSPTPKVQSTKSLKANVKVGAIIDQNGEEKPDDTSKCYKKRDIILTAVGVFISVWVVVAVMWTIRRVRKRRRRRQFGSEGYTPGYTQHPVSNGHTVPDDPNHNPDDIDHAEAEEPA